MLGSRVGSLVGALVGASVGSSVDDEGSTRLVIGLAGQSNAVGFADIDNANNINQYIANQYAPVTLYQQDGTNANPPVWTFYTPEGVKPRAHATLNTGVHLTLARYLNRREPNRWALAGIGIGSTGLNDHWKKTAVYPTTPPNLYNQMLSMFRNSVALAGGRLAAMVWIQGEQDATDAADAAAYEANLTTFISDVRLEFPGLPFVIVKLHTSNPGSQKAVVRAAQVAVAAAVSGVTLVDADDLALQGDNLHYTTESYFTLGNRIGAAILAALGLPLLLPSFYTSYRGLTINAFDTSVRDLGTVTAWDWDWGDGSAHSTTQNPSHTYGAGGHYAVTLAVTDNTGVVRRTTQNITAVTRTWSVDAASGIGVPNTGAELTDLETAHLLAVGAAHHLYRCQEAPLSNLADSIGSKTLTAGGAPGMQQAVTGWTRLAVGASGLATNQTFNNTAMVNLNASSVATLGYIKYNQGAAIRQVMFHGAASGNAMEAPAGTKKGRLRNGANVGGSTLDFGDEVLPFVLLFDRTHQDNVLITPREIIRIGYLSSSGAELRFTVGSAADVTVTAQVLYSLEWEGASAERTVAEWLALLWALGWPITVPGD